MLLLWQALRTGLRIRGAGLACLPQAQRERALARWQILRAHLEDGRPLARLAAEDNVPERTPRRWLAAYRSGGLTALARRPRPEKGVRRMPPELKLLIEGLALRRRGAGLAGAQLRHGVRRRPQHRPGDDHARA
jgi:putative transposase